MLPRRLRRQTPVSRELKDSTMNKFLAVILLSLPLLGCSGLPKFEAPSDTEVVMLDDEISLASVKLVKQAIENVHKDYNKKTLRVFLSSPGGHAIAGLYVARLLQQEADRGQVVVETRAEGWCASACTFIVASGTKGHRTADPYTFVLVHPIQRGGMFGSSCVEWVKEPKDQGDKAGNAILSLARDIYMKGTGKDYFTVTEWLTCGKEIAGKGQVLVDLGMADRLE